MWCDLRAYQTSKRNTGKLGGDDDPVAKSRADDDETIMKKLLAKKVFLASGAAFGAEHPGWYRIVFAYPTPYLKEGLQRMVAALD